ncbi:vitellogenin-like [Colletes gigas]|uniref:vitellogenin-like n=1 Tax=Colletes gigas TaxID=935657 RepID=UPI001C9B9E03|nr:vitellogenin-like [Colletes gigas]
MRRHFLEFYVFKMWLPLTLLILAGTCSADFEHGWKIGNEYTYLVRSRTLTGLEKLSDQAAGILLKAHLTIQVRDGNTLVAKVSNCQYARIHKSLPGSWHSEISDQMLDLRELPISGQPFLIKVGHGIIRDLIVDRDVPTWELNILKSIVSQLQVDTQGENAIKKRDIQEPTDEEPFGIFRAMEDTVTGKCEVHYDIMPLSEHMIDLQPELVPMPDLKGNGMHIDIMKTRNFSRCDQRMGYHFGISGQNDWEPGSNLNGEFLSKSSTSRIIVSGNLKRFTIQSSVTTSRILVSPRFYDNQNGVVVSVMNLTLANINRVKSQLSGPSNPESTGNLVYVYADPFSDMEDRRNGKQTEALNSNMETSDSASSENSGWISSSDEQFWQPRPTLEDPPQIPLLPNFIGYKGKFIDKSKNIDIQKLAKELIYQIANEIEDASNIPSQGTLEKFTLVIDLIRMMGRNKLMSIANEVFISPNQLKSNDKSQAVKQNAWAVLRDAVTQAGTGPALLTIKHWIEKGDVTGLEAAGIVSRIPKTARAPTAEYVKAFFQLATNPKVMKEELLNTASILAFSELVRLSQVNDKTIHNLYPVHTFGRMTPKNDKTVVNEYIPYLANELKKAAMDRDSKRMQTYILALGSIGHPKILSVFEPYLEGKEPVTVFQRTLIVSSLSKLIEMHPRLTRLILYKIYLNTKESHEVRCMAIFLLMTTNPPLSMLQRIASFTNFDTSKQVNSAVKSSIQSMANMKIPGSEDMARKAQAVINLLNTETYAYQLSHGFVNDAVLNNVMHRTIIKYIGSDDSLIPKSMYYGSFSSFGDFKVPPKEFMAMLSTVKPLIDMLFADQKKQSSERSWTQKIAEELNIIPEEPMKMEGNIMWNSKYSSYFWPFDKKELNNLNALMATYFTSMQDGRYINVNKFMSYDVVLSFPTDTGLPFVHTLSVPTLYKATGNNRMMQGSSIDIKSSMRMVHSTKVQGRIGFVTPFDHRHFISGVDVNFQMYAPVEVELGGAPNNVQLKIRLLEGEEKARLVQYSVIPYTSSHDILHQRPLLEDKNTHVVQSGETMINSIPLINEEVKAWRLNVEADKSNKNLLSMENVYSTLMYPWSKVNDKFRKIELIMDLEQPVKEPVLLTATIDAMDIQSETVDSRLWTPIAMAVEPIDKKGNSNSRRKQFLEEVTKGIKSATSGVLDVELQLPGELELTNAFTVAWSKSNVDNKQRNLFYWNFNTPALEGKYEVCASSQTETSDNILPMYEKAVNIEPKKKFDVAIRYGTTCSENKQINVKAKLTQTNQMKETVKNSNVVGECKKQMKQGNKILRACQEAAGLATLLDQVDVTLDIPSNELLEMASAVVDIIDDTRVFNVRTGSTKPKNADKNKIDIKAKVSTDLNAVDMVVHTPDVDVWFDDVSLLPFGIASDDLVMANSDMQEMLANDNLEPTCVLDNTRAETFDRKEYPLRLGNCWHVVMTTYPKMDPAKPDEKLRLTEDTSVSILTRGTDDGDKEVKVLLDEREILLLARESHLRVKLNGREIKISKDKSHQEIQGDKVLFEIFRFTDGSIGLVSDHYSFKLGFDGKRILLKSSETYRDSVRGLCGNFDGDATNDFLGPKNCVLRKPDEFVATYALTKNQCEGEALEMAQKARTFECLAQDKTIRSNVITDVDAGRADKEDEAWGYHQKQRKNNDKRCSAIHRTLVEKIDGKLCFTTRPIIACPSSCTATETKSKTYQFHCREINKESRELQKRIEKGASPDLSQKQVHMSRSIDVPFACEA